jgi:hypothetical protein
LLAAGSLGIEKIQENGLFRLPGGLLGFGQIVEPTNIQGHAESSFRTGLALGFFPKSNHFQVDDKGRGQVSAFLALHKPPAPSSP